MMNQKLRNPARWMAALASVCVIVVAGCGSDGPDAPATSTNPPPFGPWTDSSDIGDAALTAPGIPAPGIQFTTDNAGGLIAYSTASAIEQGQKLHRVLINRFTPALGWHSPYLIQVEVPYHPGTQVFPFRDKLKEDGLMVIIMLPDRTLTHVVYGGTRWMLPVTTMGPPSGYTLTADGTLLRSSLQTQPTLQGEVSKFSDGQWQSYKQFPIQVAGLMAADQPTSLQTYEYRDGVYGALGVYRPAPTPEMYPCGPGHIVDLSGGLATGSALSGTRGEPMYCTANGFLGRYDIRVVTVAGNGSLHLLAGDETFPHAYSMVAGQWVESVISLRSSYLRWYGYTDQGALVAFGSTQTAGPESSLFEGSTPVKITRASDGSQRLATGSWRGLISETAQFAVLRDTAAPSWGFYERIGPASYLERTDIALAYPAAHVIESGNAQYAVLKGSVDANAVFRVKWRTR